MTEPAAQPLGPRIAHWLALAAVVFTWPLLMVGGYVSVYRLGMAVPDWPTTFGLNMFYYNLFEAPRGVFAEHAHRLYASLVGIACVGLAAYYSITRLRRLGVLLGVVALAAATTAAINPVGNILGLRPFIAGLTCLGVFAFGIAAWAWVRRRDSALALAWLALASVVAQGAIGGSRVTQNSTMLAFLHGVFAQGVFALLVVLWVITSGHWQAADHRFVDPVNLRRRANNTLMLISMQIVAGAAVRHFGSGAALAAHVFLALAVAAHVALLYLLTPREGDFARQLRLRGPILAMCAIASAQVALGIAATVLLWPFDGVPRPVDGVQALARLAHQGLGALLLASATVLSLRAWRVLGATGAELETKATSAAPIAEALA